MKKILIAMLILISSVSMSQYKYNKGQTIVVDSSLTIYNISTVPHGAAFTDIKTENWSDIINIKARWRYDLIFDTCITAKPGITQLVIDIFKEVFTDEELRTLMIGKFSDGTNFSFCYHIDKHSNTSYMWMTFRLIPSFNDIDPVKVGKLYKLMYEKVRFNIKDIGAPDYILFFQIYLKQIVEGTLNLDMYQKPRIRKEQDDYLFETVDGKEVLKKKYRSKQVEEPGK